MYEYNGAAAARRGSVLSYILLALISLSKVEGSAVEGHLSRLKTTKTTAQWMLALTGIDIEACPRCGHRPLQSIELPPINPHHLPPRRGPPHTETHTDTTT